MQSTEAPSTSVVCRKFALNYHAAVMVKDAPRDYLKRSACAEAGSAVGSGIAGAKHCHVPVGWLVYGAGPCFT